MSDEWAANIEIQEAEPFAPVVRSQCICRPPIEVDGVLYTLRDPCCLHPKHGTETRYIEPVGRTMGDSRTVGVPHSKTGSRRKM